MTQAKTEAESALAGIKQELLQALMKSSQVEKDSESASTELETLMKAEVSKLTTKYQGKEKKFKAAIEELLAEVDQLKVSLE